MVLDLTVEDLRRRRLLELDNERQAVAADEVPDRIRRQGLGEVDAAFVELVTDQRGQLSSGERNYRLLEQVRPA